MLNMEHFGSIFNDAPVLRQECYAHFSQGGEDVVIDVLLMKEQHNKGIFVDIGAYHPFRYSNTFLLYLQGWRGINVDANPDSINLFKQIRTEDINIHALVSDRVEELNYYIFNEGAYNTTNTEAAELLNARGTYECSLRQHLRFNTVPVNQILEQYTLGRKFDLLTVDVEGMDERLINSIDFDRFRPKVLCVELDIENCTVGPVGALLRSAGYEFRSQCVHSAIFLNKGE